MSTAAVKTVDIGDRFVAPGFIDAHVHIESSMVCITEFARAVLPFGTTSVVADPHEIANVLGKNGIDYMLQSSEKQPINVYFTLLSCVPATDMKTAVAAVVQMGGGLAAVCNGQIYSSVPLTIGGLMSEASVQTVRSQLDRIIGVAQAFGTILQDPFMTLSFLALPVIPELKVTDKGLVDVTQFKIVSLFVE